MRSDVARDLGDSAFEFLRVVWPQIEPWMSGGELYPVEAVSHDGFNKHLDALAGIDAWQIKHNHGIRGIASRVQWIDPDNPKHKRFDTFSIRTKRPNGAETEFAKRMRIIRDPDGGWLLPEFTVQAYVSEPKREGELLSVAVVRTRQLFMRAHMLMIQFETASRRDWGMNAAGNGGEEFVWLHWDYIKREMPDAIRVYRRPENILLPDPVWLSQYDGKHNGHDNTRRPQ